MYRSTDESPFADQVQYLPDATQAVVAALGWDAALWFLREQGGDKYSYVPKVYNEDCRLFERLSREQAEALIAAFGGCDIRFPGHKKMLVRERNQLILDDHRKRGFDLNLLADKYNITKVGVWYVLSLWGYFRQ